MIALTPTHALVVLRQSHNIIDNDARERLDRWALGELDRDVPAGAASVLAMWEGALNAGATTGLSIWQLGHGYACAAIDRAIEDLLAARPTMPVEPFRLILAEAMARVPRPALDRLADAALAREDLASPARALWSILLFNIRGETARPLLDGHDPDDLRTLLGDSGISDLFDRLPVESEAERASRAAAVIRLLGPSTLPEETDLAKQRTVQPKRTSYSVQRAITNLQSNPNPQAATLIAECVGSANLGAWRSLLLHAQSAQAKLLADTSFTPPTLEDVLALLGGGPPLNAADLRAIIVDELRRLGQALRNEAGNPWLDYWNTDSDGKPLDPKIENVARDITQRKLQAPLEKYQIAVNLQEVERKLSTRVDLYFATHNGRNLPIEAKRHFHRDLWQTATGQLQDYTTSEGACGVGVLLVFWFGADWISAPTRPDGHIPTSAAELEALLVADLPPNLRDLTDVIVLDVSRPGGGESQQNFNKRMDSAETPRLRSAAKMDNGVTKRGGDKRGKPRE